MVTSRHEASHRIFQDRPELLSPVFDLLGVPLPAPATVDVLTPDATEIRPLERRVDSVLHIRPTDSEADGFLLAIEAQSCRADDKPRNWACYLGHLGAKYACPVLLLVTCQDKATARWAAGPFDLGPPGWRPSHSVRPLVLGPDNVPVIVDPEHAGRDLALATFSAITHGADPDVTVILEALATALGATDGETTDYFTELLEIGLGEGPARETWRKLMKAVGTYFPGRGTIVEESYLKGISDARRQTLLRLLDKRGVPVSEAARTRIADCTDADVLDRWLDRAFTVTDAADLFTED
ncbi:MAG TPA: hypothetical protein VFH77_09235 [Streptomyces sp.]|nr:hypothetical protein [Streptomyces sp.]